MSIVRYAVPVYSHPDRQRVSALTGELSPASGEIIENAAAGSYTATGFLVSTLLGIVLSAGAVSGSYGVTGAAATTSVDKPINAEAGSYSLTGDAATTLRGLLESTGTDSYAINGAAATTLVDTVEPAVAGAYALTGFDADTTTVQTDAAPPPLFTAGTTGSIRRAQVQFRKHLFAVSRVDAVFLVGIVESADPGSYTVTGVAATTLVGAVESATAGAYTLAGFAADTAATQTAAAPPFLFTAGTTDSVRRAARVYSRTYPLAAPSVSSGFLLGNELSADSGSYALTGQAATTVRGLLESTSSGAYSVTGAAATTLKGTVLLAGASPGAYVITGLDATTIYASPNTVIVASPGSYDIAGVAATTAYGRLFSADLGSYVITGQALTTLYTKVYLLVADPGSLAFTGFAVTTVYFSGGATVLSAEPGVYIVTGAQEYGTFGVPRRTSWLVITGDGRPYIRIVDIK